MSQQADTAACMLVVLTTGFVCLSVLGLSTGATPGTDHLLHKLASGVAFAIATYCLWQAFGSGSVRLVAPIVAAYPVLSLFLATVSGESIRPMQWLLVMLVIGGVAVVARGESSESPKKDNPHEVHLREDNPHEDNLRENNPQPKTKPALSTPILWSVASAIGFATTFWVGQLAMDATENTMSVLVLTRLAAVATTVIYMLTSGGMRWPATRDIPLLCLMGLCDTIALASVLYAGNLPGNTFATVTASLFGVVTILLAWIFLKERLIPIQIAGVAITFFAIGALALI